MILTGKCKEDFEKWLILNIPLTQLGIWSAHSLWFNNLLPSLQYGVYVDFFDSVGIDIIVRYKDLRHISFTAPFEKGEKLFFVEEHESRQEARTKAIEKANEIYNSK